MTDHDDGRRKPASLDEYRQWSQDRDVELAPVVIKRLLEEAIDDIEALEAHITVLQKGDLAGGCIERKRVGSTVTDNDDALVEKAAKALAVYDGCEGCEPSDVERHQVRAVLDAVADDLREQGRAERHQASGKVFSGITDEERSRIPPFGEGPHD